MDIKEFNKTIAPFGWIEHETSFSVCLSAGDYKPEIFEAREDEGFEGGGYDWESLAVVFLDEIVPNLKSEINFDSEAGMFCAYSSNKDALKEFILTFKNTCENDAVINDLFSRAELD